MTGTHIAMNTQVTTNLLSDGVPVIVALLGIAGAVWAQLVATRRAHANALALFDRQAAAQERARTEEARREDALRFAEQKRGTYTKLLRDIDDQQAALVAAEKAARTFDRIREEVKSFDPDDLRVGRADIAYQKLQEAADLWTRKFETVNDDIYELELLASGDVLQAAGTLRDVLREAATELWAVYHLPGSCDPDELFRPGVPPALLAAQWKPELTSHWPAYRQAGEAYQPARKGLVEAAKGELGIPPLSDVQTQPERDGTTQR